MKIFFLIVCVIFLVKKSECQSQTVSPDTNYRRPSLYINGKLADPLSLMVLNKQDIKSLSVLTQAQAARSGVEVNKFGVVIVTLIKNAKVYTLKELLKFFKVKDEADQLPIMLYFGYSEDFLYLTVPKIFMASLTRIQQISIGKKYGKNMEMKLTKNYGEYENDKNINLKLDSLDNLFQLEAKRRAPKNQKVIFQ